MQIGSAHEMRPKCGRFDTQYQVLVSGNLKITGSTVFFQGFGPFLLKIHWFDCFFSGFQIVFIKNSLVRLVFFRVSDRF